MNSEREQVFMNITRPTLTQVTLLFATGRRAELRDVAGSMFESVLVDVEACETWHENITIAKRLTGRQIWDTSFDS